MNRKGVAFVVTLPLAIGCVSVKDDTPNTLSRRADGRYHLTALVETYGTQASAVTAAVGAREFAMTSTGDGRWEVDAPLDPCVQGFQLRYLVRYQQTDTATPSTVVEPPGTTAAIGGLLKWVAPSGLNCGPSRVFRVNSTEFLGDASPGDGICDANPPGSSTRRCTLKAAIDEANATPGAATVEIPAGSYSAPDYFTPTDDLVLVGLEPGVVLPHVSIYGPAGTTPTVELRNLTVRGGVRSQLGSLRLRNVRVHGSTHGTTMGGVVALGLLSIEDSTIIGNEMAGVRLQGSQARIRRSLIADNTDGGVYCVPGASAELDISDSTITGNRGFFGGVGVGERCRATLRNVTITGNQRSRASDLFSSGAGGLSFAPSATVLMANTILAGNTNTREPASADCGFYGTPSAQQSLGQNLIQTGGACRFTATLGRPDVLGVAPGVASLADNGGPTQTMLPLATSPARRAGSADPYNDAFPGACTHQDQRGRLRVGSCDIGAVQVSR